MNKDQQDKEDKEDKVVANIELNSIEDRLNGDGDGDGDDTESLKSTDAILNLENNSSATEVEPSEYDLNPQLNKFMQYCQEGNLTSIKEIIKDIDINDTFSDGITGLHWACINNRLSLVKYLIENGSNPNKSGGDLNATPLHWACRNGLVYIVDYLITNEYHKADPNLKDGQTYNALHLAVHSSNITLIIYLLLTCVGSNLYIDEPDGFNRTALHWACYQNDIFTINALLKFGADISKQDNNLFIPLHWSFMKGYKIVLKTLVEAGSDIFIKNDQDKSSFDIAKDMNCINTWQKVLKECDLNMKDNYQPTKHWIKPNTGKIITFLSPYLFLGISLSISQGLLEFILAILIFFIGIYLVNILIIPSYLIDDKPLPKSPILAGIFSGTAFWCIFIWLTKILPSTIFHNFISNVTLLSIIILFIWSFFKAMFINPGFVPTPTDNSIILQQVQELIGLGKFDTDHFCVNTFVRKPLRSKYSRYNKKLIARFDHYCPWVYNEIGVRNHKLFISFVYSLNLAILLFTYLSIKYFDIIKDNNGYDTDDEEDSLICGIFGDELCFGFKNHNFHFNLIIWCCLQYIWLVILCIVQTFQILKGLTTWEFSNLNNKLSSSRFNHSTVPKDFNDIVQEQNQQQQQPLKKPNELNTCLNLLGIDQFIMTVKLSIGSLFKNKNDVNYDPLTIDIPTNYGIKQNWKDFWIIGDEKIRNIFYLPIEDENNLNGQIVHYYKLYELPPKKSTEIV
ncbi:unnamed protein product [Candida verbasci]|uniref:Palmitoyltransferase n=1 Tax=Candida verbasci TaxID=1227364 RepID=A0A9W4TSY0_9ASCO|nr:unnamed protein product [Candida verbasci]